MRDLLVGGERQAVAGRRGDVRRLSVILWLDEVSWWVGLFSEVCVCLCDRKEKEEMASVRIRAMAW